MENHSQQSLSTSKPNFKIFLINLDRSVTRLNHCQILLEGAGIEFSRISAVDGSLLSNEKADELYNYKATKSYYKQLNNGELGCFLSHRLAWQKIIDQQLDFAVVLEDDLHDISLLPEAINSITSIKGEWDYIKLANHHRHRDFYAQKQLNNFILGVFNKLPASTIAQVVSLKGAEKLLKHSQKIYRPVDIDLQHCAEKSLLAFGLEPAPVKVQTNQTSEIDVQGNRQKANRNRFKQISQQLAFKLSNFRYRKILSNALNKITIEQDNNI